MIEQVGGIHIPAAERHMRQHFAETPGYADAYDNDLYAYVRQLKQRRVAVDVGASFGLWSMKLVKDFTFVYAFEPLDVARRCFERNVTRMNFHLHSCALGNRHGTTMLLMKPDTTFKTHVMGATGETLITTLDTFEYTLVDLIKVDCEGYDYYVLKGARKTIAAWRPLIVFESKLNVSTKRYKIPQDATHKLLRGMGYAFYPELHGNFVAYPKERAT